MGVQCNIILVYYTEVYNEIDAINRFLNAEGESKVSAIGDRQWGTAEGKTIAISMKDWGNKECNRFIRFLKTVKWNYPETVQVFWQPATHENWIAFRYKKLFSAKH